MGSTVITALLFALVVYIAVGFFVGSRAKGIADLLPVLGSRQAQVKTSSEFSASTVATTISLATVIMAFFELARYLGIWLLWTVITTSAGLFVVRLFAARIWQRISEYDHRPTLHEFLGKEFGSQAVSTVGAVFTSLGFLGAFAVELTVGSKFFTALVPAVPPLVVVAGLSAVAFLYTAVGGFRAVIVTDRIQMLSIWLLLLALPVFYIYYTVTHGGWAVGFAKMPAGTLSFSYRQGLIPFVLGIFAINVPSFISDMSIWQRIAAAQKDRTVTSGLRASAFSAAVTWGVLAILACFVFIIIEPAAGINPLLSLLTVMGAAGGFFAELVLFITVLGLYGAMLSTASTQLIAVSHTLYADIFTRFVKTSFKGGPDSKSELNFSRFILVLTATISILLVQFLSKAGFSIADLVFAVYGAQLGLCPLVLSALLMDKKRLSRLSLWATLAVSVGFVAGWGSAIYGRFINHTNLVFLAPVCSLAASSLLLCTGIVYEKVVDTWPVGLNWILIRSIIKARSNGLYQLVPADEPARLICLKDKCAKCCRVIGTPVVTNSEAGGIAAESLVKYTDAMFVKSDSCVCSLLKDGLCSVYPLRPKGCREYPWYNIDSRLYYDLGCPGISYDADERPAVDAIQPFENFFPRTPKFVVWLVKKACVKK
jgi:Na+/proline symporter/Fe-S-cluster containining protein